MIRAQGAKTLITESSSFRTFYYFTLVAWTVSSLGLASGLRKDLHVGEVAAIICSLVLTLFGWGLPVLQAKYPEKSFLVRGIFWLPILCLVLMIAGLISAVLFAAA